MSKFKNKSTDPLSNQLHLLDNGDPAAGSLNVDFEFRDSLSRAITKSGLSRWQITAQMSELTGTEITKTMLDAYTAISHHEHRFPAIFLPAFCIVCKDYQPLRVLSNASRCALLESQEARYAMIAKLEKQKDKLNKEITRLKSY